MSDPSISRSIDPASTPPLIDEEVRRRLMGRFGDEISSWFDDLPRALADLGQQWQLEYGPLIQRGSVSVVVRCQTADGQAAILKISPDRARLAHEAAALARWRTPQTPTVLADDEHRGALLIEAIAPGTPLASFPAYPEMEQVAGLLNGLHEHGVPDPAYPPLERRVANLFDSGEKPYARRPELRDVVPLELYGRGRLLATRLAEQATPGVLLHADLNPGNILDGGQRGLVAIDPAPCLGDPTFDAVDVLVWNADQADTITARASELAPMIRADAERLLDWCVAFAAMIGVELAEQDAPPRQIEALLSLARTAPTI